LIDDGPDYKHLAMAQKKLEVSDISRLRALKRSQLKQEARLLGVQQAELDDLCGEDEVEDLI
jgi:hypothetical protein